MDTIKRLIMVLVGYMGLSVFHILFSVFFWWLTMASFKLFVPAPQIYWSFSFICCALYFFIIGGIGMASISDYSKSIDHFINTGEIIMKSNKDWGYR